MEISVILHDLIFDYTLRTVALGSAILGLTSGALGTFAVLRRQSLLGDTVSHTALPGIALAFLLTGFKTPLIMILGAALAGWVGTLLVMTVIRHSRLKTDGALGLILSVFFGFGLVLLTFIQKMPNARQAGLENFLFGQATALLESDVIIMGIIAAIVMVILVLFWKEFKLVSFDAEFGSSLGLSMRFADYLLTTILVIAIIIGLQAVGVVLMSAMVVAPAAAARQWTDRLGVMIILSAMFGALAGISGTVISSLTAKMPTGPTIVLCVSLIVIVSLLMAPNRGLIWNAVRRLKSRKELVLDSVLLDLYELADQHDDQFHPHSVMTLQAMGISRGGIVNSLKILAERGLVEDVSGNNWILTAAGAEEAARLVKALDKK
jgi:manganese/zinc/iron transport system permease protein